MLQKRGPNRKELRQGISTTAKDREREEREVNGGLGERGDGGLRQRWEEARV
jgi:hypothetical protein